MALENKLGLTSSADLAREEERISKKKAVWLFESGTLDKLSVGTFASDGARRLQGHSHRSRRFTRRFLKTFMTSQASFAR